MASPSFKTLLLADYRMDGAEAQSWLLSYPKYVSEKRLMQAYWWSGRGVRKTKKQPIDGNTPHKFAKASEFVRGTLSCFLYFWFHC